LAEPLGRAGDERVAAVSLTHLEAGLHSFVGQRHLVALRLKSAPANVQTPCSQAGGRAGRLGLSHPALGGDGKDAALHASFVVRPVVVAAAHPGDAWATLRA
jgi:hypothetical protein